MDDGIGLAEALLGLEGFRVLDVIEGAEELVVIVVALLIVLALVTGGVGLLIEGLRWALILTAVLLLSAAAFGFRSGAAMRGRFGRASRA